MFSQSLTKGIGPTIMGLSEVFVVVRGYNNDIGGVPTIISPKQTN